MDIDQEKLESLYLNDMIPDRYYYQLSKMPVEHKYQKQKNEYKRKRTEEYNDEEPEIDFKRIRIRTEVRVK